MDYVLFGMGYGASLMLLGWALRTFGPQLKYKNPPKEEDANYLVEQRFWLRFIQGLGGVIAIAGTAMVLMTFVVVLVNPNDDRGTTMSLAIWAFIVIAVLIWCWLYSFHYGLAGIWTRENGYGFRKTSASTLPKREPRVGTAKQVTSKPRLNRADSIPTTKTLEVDPEHASAEDEPIDETTLFEDESETTEADVVESDPAGGPVYDFGDSTETTVPSDSSGRAEALRRLRERQARARQN